MGFSHPDVTPALVRVSALPSLSWNLGEGKGSLIESERREGKMVVVVVEEEEFGNKQENSSTVYLLPV
jgi:hypothetical protein